jgi:hypothetical protein
MLSKVNSSDLRRFLNPQGWLFEQAYKCLDEENKQYGELIGLVYQPQTQSVNAFFNIDLYSMTDLNYFFNN